MRRAVSAAAIRMRGNPEVLLLTVLAVVALLPFGRLFAGERYLLHSLVAICISMAICLAAKHRSFWTSVVANAIALALFLTFVVFHVGLPAAGDLVGVWDGSTAAWASLLTTSLPALGSPQLVTVPVLCGWIASFAAVEIALRRRWNVVPIVPALIVFIVALMFTGKRSAGSELEPLCLLVLALSTVLLRTTTQTASTSTRLVGSTDGGRRNHRWTGGSGATGTSLRLGLPLVIVLAAAAAVLGTVAPVTSDPERYDLRDRYDPPIQVADSVSPLAQVRAGLNSTNDTPLFTVSFHDVPEEMQLDRVPVAFLEQYDGVVWSTEAHFARVGEELPAGDATETPIATIRQDYTLSSRYRSSFIPALGRPIAIDPADSKDADFGFDREFGQLISSDPDKGGLQYTVISGVPRYTIEAQKQAPPGNDAEVSRLAVTPAAVGVWPKEVTDFANTFTGARHEVLTALESELKSEHFGYSTQATPGHSIAVLKDFLTAPTGGGDIKTARLGDAEQFAAAFAIVARAHEYPSRVVVGYRIDPAAARRGDAIAVRSADVHAWPEVHVNSVGWVAFDPTNPTPRTALPPAVAPSTTTTIPNRATPTSVPATDSPVQVSGSGSDGDENGLPIWPFVVLSLLLVAIAAVPLAKYLRRRRRRAADTPTAQVMGAWHEARDRLRGHGVALKRSMTPAEVAATAGVEAAPLARMAPIVDLALYAPVDPSEELVEAAWNAEIGLADALREQTSRLRRLQVAFDPRTLVGPRS